MTEVKEVGRRIQLLDDLRNRRNFRELKIEKDVNNSLSTEHKEERQIIFHKPLDLLISTILNNNNYYYYLYYYYYYYYYYRS